VHLVLHAASGQGCGVYGNQRVDYIVVIRLQMIKIELVRSTLQQISERKDVQRQSSTSATLAGQLNGLYHDKHTRQSLLTYTNLQSTTLAH
jgi:hypothetical protein